MIVLAHLSDVHLGPLPGFRLRDVRVKRMIGYINWRRNRQETHRAATLSRIIADVQAQNPDHVAITGDLVNLGLPGEIQQAANWLAGLGDPERYSVVPGNHDTYVHMLRDVGIMRWWGHMRSNAAGRPFCHGTGPFPFVRVVGDVALVGVSSAVPTLPVIATGQVGAAQLEATGKTLQALDKAGLARVVLIHHPPLPGQTKAIRRLRDAKLFRDLIAQFGAELVVHGHDHKQSLFWAKGPNGPVPIVGVASASAIHQDRPCRARYNLFQIAGSPGGWKIGMTGRGLIDGTGKEIGQLDHMVLSPT